MNYPAAYPGVIAVGALARDGQLAPFSSRHSYVSLTAPGVDLMATTPPDGYARISSTSTSSGMVAGVAALILSRYPHLTAAQVTQALTGGTVTDRAGSPGTGHGTVDATRAVDLAAAISSADQPSQPVRLPARPHKPEPLLTTAAHRASASTLAGSLVRYVMAGLCVLIALLVVLILLMRSRRERARAAAAQGLGSGSPRVRSRGLHEHRKPESGPGPGQVTAGRGGLTGLAAASPPRLTPPAGHHGRLARRRRLAGRQRGEIAHSSGAPYRPVITPPPKAAKTAKAAANHAGPPWAPAPEPERTIGPLPTVASSALPPDPGPGIRVPGDMAALTAVAPDSLPPAPFDFTTSPDPDFPPRPAVSDDTIRGFPRYPDLPTRQSLGFAAAPVPVDYAPPQAPDFTVPSRAAGLVLSADSNPATPPRPAGRPPRHPPPIPALSGTWLPPMSSRPPSIPAQRRRRRAPSPGTTILAPAAVEPQLSSAPLASDDGKQPVATPPASRVSPTRKNPAHGRAACAGVCPAWDRRRAQLRGCPVAPTGRL